MYRSGSLNYRQKFFFCSFSPAVDIITWIFRCPNPLDPSPSKTVLSGPKPPTPQSQTRRFTITTFQFLPAADYKDMDEEVRRNTFRSVKRNFFCPFKKQKKPSEQLVFLHCLVMLWFLLSAVWLEMWKSISTELIWKCDNESSPFLMRRSEMLLFGFNHSWINSNFVICFSSCRSTSCVRLKSALRMKAPVLKDALDVDGTDLDGIPIINSLRLGGSSTSIWQQDHI